jgi:uncharacterized protein
MARSLGNELGLAGDRLERLAQACASHADGRTSDDPTIGACWDADRLNLWRVGMAPARSMLSIEATVLATPEEELWQGWTG